RTSSPSPPIGGTCLCGWPIPSITARPSPTRPLLLEAIGRQTHHAGRTMLTITSTHGQRHRARRALTQIAAFFAELRETAEQLTHLDRWYRILSRALVKYLKGRQLDPPRRLQP